MGLNQVNDLVNLVIFLDIGQRAFQLAVKYLPGINSYIQNKKGKIYHELQEGFEKVTTKKTLRLPDNEISEEKINSKLEEWLSRDQKIYGSGKISGGLYLGYDKKFEQNMKEFTSKILLKYNF